MSRSLAVILANTLAADEMYVQLTVLPGWIVIGRVRCEGINIRTIRIDNKAFAEAMGLWRKALRAANDQKIHETGQVLLNQGLACMVEAIPARVQRIFVAGDEVLTGAPLGALAGRAGSG